MRRTLVRFLALTAGFFALYALTAQRGLGWGDSGEFQHWVLHGCPVGVKYPSQHPLYLAAARLVASTPFGVTLVSAFFGALSVGGLYLCVRRRPPAVLFGLSHMLWWNSCVAEVQTMNLAFTGFETALLLRAVETRGVCALTLLFALNGLHTGVHNFAFLCLPVFLFTAFRLRFRPLSVAIALLGWALGAAGFLRASLAALAGDGPVGWFRLMMVGDYGAKVCGLLPSDGMVTGFNFALAALSFAVPAALAWWSRGRPSAAGESARIRRVAVGALFAVNALFWVRYFVPDQAMFVLPTLFFAYVMLGTAEIRANRLAALALLQVLLPVAAYLALSGLPLPQGRGRHGDRDDAAYFALPWKMNEDSADRHAAAIGGIWDGYPE